MQNFLNLDYMPQFTESILFSTESIVVFWDFLRCHHGLYIMLWLTKDLWNMTSLFFRLMTVYSLQLSNEFWIRLWIWWGNYNAWSQNDDDDDKDDKVIMGFKWEFNLTTFSRSVCIFRNIKRIHCFCWFA